MSAVMHKISAMLPDNRDSKRPRLSADEDESQIFKRVDHAFADASYPAYRQESYLT